MSTSLLIKTTSLNYHYSKGVQVLHDINLHVKKGSIYGFLGPNGAGKTTTLRLLLGLLKNQQGGIRIFDEDFSKNRLSILKRVGALIEQPSLYGHLTARENLEVYRGIYKVDKKRTDEILQLVGLGTTDTKKAKQFSLGMKQRLSIGIALLPDPELLILDEPTNGLDPNGIIETRELIKTLNRERGVTVIVSSHILAEIEKMASDVGIINHGKLLFQGALKELHDLKSKRSMLFIETNDNERAYRLLQSEFNIEKAGGQLSIPFQSNEITASINRILVQSNLDVYKVQPMESDLEQLFIEITKENKI